VILITRGRADSEGAQSLRETEKGELERVRALGRAPSGDEIGVAYRDAGKLLWKRQHRKCAYCEHVEQLKRNDVDHFRPKARADRRPGSSETHGYWWLAWRWDNLLFSCRNCNQASLGGAGKLDKFPLEVGSGVLVAEQDPNGADATVERPLLIDPARESGIDHIEFVRRAEGNRSRWRPVARNGSARGAKTIEVCALDRDDLLELYAAHVDGTVAPLVGAFDETIGHPYVSAQTIADQWNQLQNKLYRPGMAFVGLSYDALRVLVHDSDLSEHGLTRHRPR
jgi:uncharacterized protein (TIGR02646 family)